MSTEDGDEKICYCLSAAAAGRSQRMGGHLDCRPSLAACRIAPGSIFLGGFGVCSNIYLLLLLLQQVGIGGTVLKWLPHFLSERVLEVTFSGEVQPDSDMHTLFVSNKGVPKEVYCMGHLLFNLYVSDLQDVARANGASLPSFADDFTLYCSRKTMDKAVDAVVTSQV